MTLPKMTSWTPHKCAGSLPRQNGHFLENLTLLDWTRENQHGGSETALAYSVVLQRIGHVDIEGG